MLAVQAEQVRTGGSIDEEYDDALILDNVSASGCYHHPVCGLFSSCCFQPFSHEAAMCLVGKC